jgi:hypothetical protein
MTRQLLLVHPRLEVAQAGERTDGGHSTSYTNAPDTCRPQAHAAAAPAGGVMEPPAPALRPVGDHRNAEPAMHMLPRSAWAATGAAGGRPRKALQNKCAAVRDGSHLLRDENAWKPRSFTGFRGDLIE